MTQDFSERPNRIPWPPILYLLAVAAAFMLQAAWPAGVWLPGDHAWLQAVGVVLAGLGLGFDLGAMWSMQRSKTNILPHRGAQHLVTSGVFALSRNPIYLGNTLLVSGLALAMAWPWLLGTGLIAAALVDRLAIRREERHLSARFGPAFVDYASRVPRWIGFRRRDPGSPHRRSTRQDENFR